MKTELVKLVEEALSEGMPQYNAEETAKYTVALVDNIYKKYKKVDGWEADVDPYEGTLSFVKDGYAVFATPLWEEDNLKTKKVQVVQYDKEGTETTIRSMPMKFSGNLGKDTALFLKNIKHALTNISKDLGK